MLGVEQLSVQMDIEDAVLPFDQLGPCAQLALDLVRQTGGPWTVVSDDTVFDGDLRHRDSLTPISVARVYPSPGAFGRAGETGEERGLV